MHDTAHGASAPRAHSSNTAPATLLQLYERFSSSKVDMRYFAAHARCLKGNQICCSRSTKRGEAKLKGTLHSLCELSPGEACGCFVRGLVWVHMKLLHGNAWF